MVKKANIYLNQSVQIVLNTKGKRPEQQKERFGCYSKQRNNQNQKRTL